MLALAGGVVLFALLLQVRADQGVEPRWLPGYPLPELCGSKIIFNADCAGCGLTRSLIFLSRGDWQSSLRMHRFGWLIGSAILLQIPYRGIALATRIARPLGKRLPLIFGFSLVLILVGNWTVTMLVSRLHATTVTAQPSSIPVDAPRPTTTLNGLDPSTLPILRDSE